MALSILKPKTPRTAHSGGRPKHQQPKKPFTVPFLATTIRPPSRPLKWDSRKVSWGDSDFWTASGFSDANWTRALYRLATNGDGKRKPSAGVGKLELRSISIGQGRGRRSMAGIARVLTVGQNMMGWLVATTTTITSTDQAHFSAFSEQPNLTDNRMQWLMLTVETVGKLVMRFVWVCVFEALELTKKWHGEWRLQCCEWVGN